MPQSGWHSGMQLHERSGGHCAEGVDVVAHHRQRWIGEPGSRRIVPCEDRQVRRNLEAVLDGRRQAGHRHGVVVVDNGCRR